MVIADDQDSKKLVDYINSLADFVKSDTIDGSYGHIGTTLADAVL